MQKHILLCAIVALFTVFSPTFSMEQSSARKKIKYDEEIVQEINIEEIKNSISLVCRNEDAGAIIKLLRNTPANMQRGFVEYAVETALKYNKPNLVGFIEEQFVVPESIYHCPEIALLHNVAYYKCLESVKFLIEVKKVSPNLLHKKCAPLHSAAKGGSAQVVAYLLRNGALATLKTQKGSTPLDIAILYKNHAAIACLQLQHLENTQEN